MHEDDVYKVIFSALGKFRAQTGDATRLPESEVRVGWEMFELRDRRYRKTITSDSPWRYWSRLVTVRSKRRGKLFDRRTGKSEFKFSIGADFLNWDVTGRV
jgi:hypothetical protein